MDMIRTALSAFGARATGGRRGVLLACSVLVALGLLGVAALIARGARVEHVDLDPVALADLFAVSLLGAALFVIAPAMVAANVAEERRHGTLDLLRTAPLSPTALTVGFLTGAPGGVYLLLSGPFALHVLAGVLGVIPISTLAASVVLLALGSVVLMLLAALGVLALSRHAAGAAGPMLIAGLLGLFAFISIGMAGSPEMMPWAFVHPAGAIAQLYTLFEGPGRDSLVGAYRVERMAEPLLGRMLAVEALFATAVYAVAAVLLLGAARRALASDPVSRLSKHEALGLFAISVVALLVPMRVTIVPGALERGHVAAIGLALFGPYVACVIGATPNQRRVARGRLRPESPPLWVALVMVAALIGALGSLYGTRGVFGIWAPEQRSQALGFVLAALTLPIFALYGATRIGTAAGRLAFWALVIAHGVLLVPAIMIGLASDPPSGEPLAFLLARMYLGFGLLVPCLVAWRQHVGDRERVVPAV